MENFIKCSQCHGRKVISPLGGIEKKCDVCSGVGFLENHPISFINDPCEPQETPLPTVSSNPIVNELFQRLPAKHKYVKKY